MDIRPTTAHWGAVSKLFHWVLAALIIGMLIIGSQLENIEDTQLKFQLFQQHKSIGFTIMALAILRLGWRFANPVPPLPASLPTWQRLSSHASHLALYGLMILQPLVGWVMVSASGFAIPTKYFGLFVIPDIAPDNQALYEAMKTTHGILAWAFALILLVHVGAALKHHFIDKDTVLSRMLPGRPKKA